MGSVRGMSPNLDDAGGADALLLLEELQAGLPWVMLVLVEVVGHTFDDAAGDDFLDVFDISGSEGAENDWDDDDTGVDLAACGRNNQ